MPKCCRAITPISATPHIKDLVLLAARSSDPWHEPPAAEVIRLLLKEGANITTANNDGDTACDVARSDDESTREFALHLATSSKFEGDVLTVWDKSGRIAQSLKADQIQKATRHPHSPPTTAPFRNSISVLLRSRT